LPNLVHHILLVEDQDDDVFLMERALRRAGIGSQLHRASDGVEAVEYLSGIGAFQDRERHPEPQLVFLDIKLPRMDGFEVLEWIHRNLSSPPPCVVMLTSSDQVKEQVRARELGARDYTVKPPTSDLFARLGEEHNLEWPQV
jgi:CheY-like chemotaxis protein